MSAPTTTTQDPQPQPPEEPQELLTNADVAREEAHVEAEAEKPHTKLHEWSRWVHVGQGAEECEKRWSGDCEDDDHFHAWIRLPNPYQIRDITAKARAARARKKRELADEESDARVSLEYELQDLADTGSKEVLVDEILDRDFADDYAKAVREVDGTPDPNFIPENEDDEIPKLWEHIDQDREEYQRQSELPEDQRDEAEYTALEKTVAEYGRAVEDELAKIREPRKAALMERPMLPDGDDQGLVNIIRQDRIDQAATEAYIHTYNTWMWFICTYTKSAPKKITPVRVFNDLSTFKFSTPTEVIRALQLNFEALETNAASPRTRAGKNS